jgi:hypothetical protein
MRLEVVGNGLSDLAVHAAASSTLASNLMFSVHELLLNPGTVSVV